MANGPLKYDKEKVRLELIPPEFLYATGRALTYGERKYTTDDRSGAGNWATEPGFDWSRLHGALLRHVTAWANGEDNDPDSGLSHLDHAAASLAFLVAHVGRNIGVDDRVSVGIAPRVPSDVNLTERNQGQS